MLSFDTLVRPEVWLFLDDYSCCSAASSRWLEIYGRSPKRSSCSFFAAQCYKKKKRGVGSKVEPLKDSSSSFAHLLGSVIELVGLLHVVKTLKSHKSAPSGAAAVTQAAVTWPPGLQHKFNTCGELLPHTAMCPCTLAQHTVLKKTLSLFLMTLCLLREKKRGSKDFVFCAKGERKKKGTRNIPVVSRQPRCSPP